MDRRSLVLFGLGFALTAASGCVPAAPSIARSGNIDGLLVKKEQRNLSLLSDGKLIKSFPIQLGSDPVGHKIKQGDGRTPEGNYRITLRNPQSQYHLSLKISYPSPEDRRRAAAVGVSPGGDIFVHGMPNWAKKPLEGDWTAGCIALSNPDMEELWSLVPVGCPISIKA